MKPHLSNQNLKLRECLRTYACACEIYYPYGVRAGQLLYCARRYKIALVSDSELAPLQRRPEGRLRAARSRDVCTIDPSSATVASFGRQLAGSSTALMSMLSIEGNAHDLDVANP
jgi:hypothetical protein